MTAVRRNPHRRRIAAIILALLAIYSVALRSTPIEAEDAVIAIRPLGSGRVSTGGFTVEGLWRLTGHTAHFGGYSALAVSGDTLQLFSDQGMWLTIPLPGAAPMEVSGALHEIGNRRIGLRDIESATRDPATGTFWLGYEHRHTIARYRADGAEDGHVFPAYTQGWYANGGLEALARLADGRFIALKEAGDFGFLYATDPLESAEGTAFAVRTPGGFSITDVAQLPDGRVLLVLRKVGMHLPPFEGMIALADPAEISPDDPWIVTPLARIEAMLPRDNYEAIATEPRADGSVTVWLASDDNTSMMQRSLLARLRFTPPPRH